MAVTEQADGPRAVVALAVRPGACLELLAPRGLVAVIKHVVGAYRRQHAEVGLGVEIRHVGILRVVTAADLQAQVDLQARRAVHAFAAGQQRFEAVVAIAEMGRAQRQLPLTTFVGAPAHETAAAIGADVTVQGP
ncbi:hypothetical protein D3C73_1343770 [compost metagenome]